MFQQLEFYIAHSWNDLRVNGQRTFFALLCIAAGVAAIVSLQTLGAMIQNTLTSNLQQTNRGDIQIQAGGGNNPEAEETSRQAALDGKLEAEALAFGGGEGTQYYFTEQGYQELQEWFNTNYPGSELTYRQNVVSLIAVFTGSGLGTLLQNPSTQAEAVGAFPVMIESDVYPFYDNIVSQSGEVLADMLNEPTDIIVNTQIAQTLGVAVGDTIQIEGIEQAFTVRGIVETSAEVRNPTQDIFAALNGFYMLDVRSLILFPELPFRASSVYVRLNEGTDVADVETRFDTLFTYARSTTTKDLERTYETITTNVNQLVTVMGLVALLLGSIGIINTMQVIVRRRVAEIAVLKTVGLQANQVTVLFLTEAFIMGIIGSIAGVLLGWAMVFVIRGVAEGVLGQPLPFLIAPNAVLAGVIVGTFVTTVFGFIPTLSAGQIRPALVLRPDDNPIPKAGKFRTFLALIFIMVLLSVVAALVLGSVLQAVAVIIGAFLIAGILYLLLLLLIWLVGRFFPSFGIIDLKIALREMLVTRSRNAVTLLALVVGVFSLSLITLLANTVTNTLGQLVLSSDNVIIQVGSEEALQQVETAIAGLQGENTYTVNRTYRFEIQQILKADGTMIDRSGIEQRLRETDVFLQSQATPEAGEELTPDQRNRQANLETRRIREFDQRLGAYDLASATNTAPTDEEILSGRAFNASDTGAYITITASDAITDLGVVAGDKFVMQYSYGGFLGIGATTGEITVEVLGVRAESLAGGFGQAQNLILPAAIPAEVPTSQIRLTGRFQPDQIPVLRRELANVSNTFLLETEAINRIFSALLGQFTAFPILVGLLGLVVGGIVIANSVALSTMERKKEIAIMKSVGLQRERVLGMLLLENCLLGIVGGLIGVGLSLVGVIILLQGSQDFPIPYGTAFLLMMLCIGVSLIAALTTAWNASGEKPLNVLRYE
jgi:ABC-type antimicrobial peptide transport system permease subunit